MPYKPKKPCKVPNCPNLTDQMYCEEHAYCEVRPSAKVRGYDKRWRSARKRYLVFHPLCIKCQEVGKVTPAMVVDHIAPHRVDQTLFWDENNWQALCEPCHNRKTRLQDQRPEYKY